jgi:hypothetical protein
VWLTRRSKTPYHSIGLGQWYSRRESRMHYRRVRRCELEVWALVLEILIIWATMPDGFLRCRQWVWSHTETLVEYPAAW